MAKSLKQPTTPTAERCCVTDNMRFANSVVSVEASAPAARLSLRATQKGAIAYAKHLGFSLPKKPGQTVSKSAKHALWLGPDEWLIIDEKDPVAKLMPSRANAEFSGTDISHRNIAIKLDGQGAVNTLNAACPRDLSITAFPVGTASRTIFGKAEIVLFRTGKESFRLECWRSFAPYVWTYLLDAAQDAKN